MVPEAKGFYFRVIALLTRRRCRSRSEFSLRKVYTETCAEWCVDFCRISSRMIGTKDGKEIQSRCDGLFPRSETQYRVTQVT